MAKKSFSLSFWYFFKVTNLSVLSQIGPTNSYIFLEIIFDFLTGNIFRIGQQALIIRIEDKNETNDEKHEKEKDQTEDKEENNQQEQDPRKNRKKRRRK